jgi:hypothetical protein
LRIHGFDPEETVNDVATAISLPATVKNETLPVQDEVVPVTPWRQC